ncbi:hypothetical protein LUZ60_000644 [Juncus effusus]|nr:hypothetical protein LUZ60_000644 [Juncus effusus]
MKCLVSDLIENPWSFAMGVLSLFLVWGTKQILEWAWFRPRRLEQALRAQGLDGTVYQPIFGDVKEIARVDRKTQAKSMPLSHDITPYVSSFFHRTMKEHGKISFSWFGPLPRVMITDPELVKDVLSNKFSAIRKQKMSHAGKLLGDGLFSYEGDKWATHRRILNPAFHVEKLKGMLPAFSVCCDELIDKWQKYISPDGSFELDVWPEMQNFTGDVISRAAFGSSFQEGRRIFQLLFEQGEHIVQAFQHMQIPGHWYLPTKNNRRMRQINREVKTLLRDIIGKREKALKNGEASKQDLLGLMLESNMREQSVNGKLNLAMNIDELTAECKLFYFAGQESTSVLLTWTLVVLSMHPEWQEKAREEVLQHFGKNKPEYDELSRLKIMAMILYEVLRLYPSFLLLNRKTYKSVKLGNITYPAGVLLSVPIFFIHHDKDLWGEDATEFKPERFKEGILKASKTKDGHSAYFPFGWGPRICIGQNFALLEAKMGLSIILQHFSFELSEKYVHAPYTLLTLQPQQGARIKFNKF